MSSTDRDNPGVIAPPPLIVLAALLTGFGLEYLWPSLVIPNAVGYPVGGFLALVGFGLAFSALFGFRRAGTNAEPWQPTTALVANGPYRFTRNPMYVGLALVHLGIAAAFGGLWVAAMLVPALVTLRYGVIAREERYLEAKFGDAYRDYMGSVRRWL